MTDSPVRTAVTRNRCPIAIISRTVASNTVMHADLTRLELSQPTVLPFTLGFLTRESNGPPSARGSGKI